MLLSINVRNKHAYYLFGFFISSQVRAIKIHKNMNKHKSNANKKILSMTRRKLRNSNEKQPTAMLKIARMMIFKKICIVSSRFRCNKQKYLLSRIGLVADWALADGNGRACGVRSCVDVVT